MLESDGSTVIATIGGQPQVVTFALDGLLAKGVTIKEVIVIHLTPQNSKRVEWALVKLSAEFTGSSYAGQPCRLRLVPIRHAGAKLEDIRNETEANAAWLVIYELIAGLKAQGRHLHVCISGGRRLLALLAISTALLHFDHNDHLWHMYTDPDFLARAQDGALMHTSQEG
jgi:CRISPR-associated protein Csx14